MVPQRCQGPRSQGTHQASEGAVGASVPGPEAMDTW